LNSDKHSTKHQSGNAMIYIILSLALLGGLTMVLSRQGDQTGAQDLTFEKSEILSGKIVSYGGSAKSVVDQMEMSGTAIDSISFTRPNLASFDTGVNYNKFFHPEGGGFKYEAPKTDIFPATTVPASGWYISGNKNIEWTPTTANDVMIVAYGISQSLCASLNKKITGDITIPAITGTFKDILLSTEDGGGTDTLTAANCAGCNGKPTLCVSNSAVDIFAYYSVISAQ